MSFIEFNKVCYSYDGKKNALRGTTLRVERGEYVAVLGGNGSGKSTLAKHIDALFVPDSGTCMVAGLDTADPENTLTIRSTAGMVFQNPDDQMVTSLVEEDVAFGPENLGVAPAEIRTRVDDALEAVGMSAYAGSNPENLSGGQKQRVAIAGILAMHPDIIILDEPGAMLDPRGQRGVRRVTHELNEAGITVILITHYMHEALTANRVLVMHEGKVVLDGTPEEVFSHESVLKACSLEVPLSIMLAHELQQRGIPVSATTDLDVLKEELCSLRSNR